MTILVGGRAAGTARGTGAVAESLDAEATTRGRET